MKRKYNILIAGFLIAILISGCNKSEPEEIGQSTNTETHEAYETLKEAEAKSSTEEIDYSLEYDIRNVNMDSEYGLNIINNCEPYLKNKELSQKEGFVFNTQNYNTSKSTFVVLGPNTISNDESFLNNYNPDLNDQIVEQNLISEVLNKNTHMDCKISASYKMFNDVTFGIKSFEREIFYYIKEYNTSVYYRITPVYQNNNLLGVILEGQSKDKKINFNVFVRN